ncbi:MAG: hypothetical protein ACK5L8_07025 [Marinicella pacifica]
MKSLKEKNLKDLKRLIKHLPLNSKSKTLLILKGHLIIEDLLRQYLDSRFQSPKELNKCRLSFSQLLYLVKSFFKPKPNEWFWKAAIDFNSIRNDLSHQLEPDNVNSKINDFVNKVYSCTDFKIKPIDNSDEYLKLANAISILYLTISLKTHEHLSLAEGLKIYSENE